MRISAGSKSACWTRLSDLVKLGLLTKDQRSILADQVEVEDGEVLRHLLMESSDKIVKLAGDLLYERNAISNIDGGRGNVVIIEPDGSNPELDEDIVIETRHSVMRFSVGSCRDPGNGTENDDNELLDFENIHASVSPVSRHLSRGHSAKMIDSTKSPAVSRRAFKASHYIERLRSQSHIYSSDAVRDSDESSLRGSGSISSSSNSPVRRKNEGSGSSEQDSPLRRGNMQLTKSPSARLLQGKSLSRYSSFEDETHVTIAIEEDATTNDNNKQSRKSPPKLEKKVSGIFSPLTRKFSKLWGLSTGNQCDNEEQEFDFEDAIQSSPSGRFDKDAELLVDYGTYSSWKNEEDGMFSHSVGSDISEELRKKSTQEKDRLSGDSEKSSGQVVEGGNAYPPANQSSFIIGSFRKFFMVNKQKKKEKAKIDCSVAASFTISNDQLSKLSKVNQQQAQAGVEPVLPPLDSPRQGVNCKGDKVSTYVLQCEDGGSDVDSSVHSGQEVSSKTTGEDELVTYLPSKLQGGDSYEAIADKPDELDAAAIRVPKHYLELCANHNPIGLTVKRNSSKKKLPSFMSMQQEMGSLRKEYEHTQERRASKRAEMSILGQAASEASAIQQKPAKYTKPLKSAISKGPKSGTREERRIQFSSVEIRFFSYSTGSGIPSDGGPSLGLHGPHEEEATLRFHIETFEDFRGGIVPEEEEYDEEEEWNDNWRLPREYFVDHGGHLPIADRVSLLRSCGVRRCSIDLSTFLCKLEVSSRLKNSRSKAPRMLIEGADPDEVMELLVKWESIQKLEPFLIDWARRWLISKSKSQ